MRYLIILTLSLFLCNPVFSFNNQTAASFDTFVGVTTTGIGIQGNYHFKHEKDLFFSQYVDRSCKAFYGIKSIYNGYQGTYFGFGLIWNNVKLNDELWIFGASGGLESYNKNGSVSAFGMFWDFSVGKHMRSDLVLKINYRPSFFLRNTFNDIFLEDKVIEHSFGISANYSF